MTTLSIIEILYLVLIVFSSIIWTLLILVLIRVYKILWPMVEMLEIYNKMKTIFKAYANIPEMVKNKVSETLSKKD